MELFTVYLSFVLIGIAVCDNSSLYNCTPRDPNLPPATPPSNGPPFPILPKTFTTKVEATLVLQNRTVSAEEYYDYDNNRAAIFMLKSGSQYKLIFDYDTNELVYVMPDLSCLTANLTTDNNKLLMDYSQLPGGLHHVLPANQALHFAAKYGQTYMGKTKVRGIQCDHWRTCLTWPNVHSTFTLDYYFTSNKWITADGEDSVPVRAEIFGHINQDGALMSKPFHDIYDYIGFNGLWKPQNQEHVFQTPPRVACPGRKQTRVLPQWSSAFAFREEIIDSRSTRYIDIWYDQAYKLVRYDSYSPRHQLQHNNVKTVSEIHDFNTGVAYIFDKLTGNCSIYPIPNFAFHASSAATSSRNKLKMRTPAEFFNLDDTYVYSGRRQTRGLYCDVFTERVLDFPEGDLVMYNATREMYILSDNPTAGRIPVQQIFDYPNIATRVTYNFYDFIQEKVEISDFDISVCFDDDTKTDFYLTFFGTFGETLMLHQKYVLFQTISAVATAAEVSPIRISNPHFHVQEGRLHFAATLLDEAPISRTLDIAYQKVPLSTAWKNLKNSVNKRSLQIHITVNETTTTYTVQEIRKSKYGNPDISSHYIQSGSKPIQTSRPHGVIAFYAHASHHIQSPGHNQILVFDMELKDTVNAYDESNGVFRAPQTGLYVFSWSLRLNGGELTSELMVNTAIQGTLHRQKIADGVVVSVNQTEIIHVNQGDEVYIRIHGKGTVYSDVTGRSLFTGWLLE